MERDTPTWNELITVLQTRSDNRLHAFWQRINIPRVAQNLAGNLLSSVYDYQEDEETYFWGPLPKLSGNIPHKSHPHQQRRDGSSENYSQLLAEIVCPYTRRHIFLWCTTGHTNELARYDYADGGAHGNDEERFPDGAIKMPREE